MTQMTGGQALVRSMLQEGIRLVFGVPTAGQYEVVDAIWESPEVRYISVRHEQAAAYMADGYARASGQIAGVVVAPGPGLLNALAAMATSSDACSPMLVVSNIWRSFGGDAPNDESYWPMARWRARLDRPAEIPAIVREAVKRMKTGLPGPMLLQLSPGTLAKVEEVDLLEPEEFELPGPDPDLIRSAAQLMNESVAPLIWAGGGIHRAGAAEQLLAVAEHLQAPVVTSPAGKGAISDRHPLSLGLGERRYEPLARFLARRDVILAVGTKAAFADRADQRLVRIDIDARRTRGDEAPDIGIIADARASLAALYSALRAFSPHSDATIAAEVAALLEERFAAHNQLEPQRSLMQAVRATVPDDGVIVQGMNQMGYYSRNYLPTYASRSYLTASHHGTLGYAFPVGLGAKIARPDSAVVVLSGDGGFLYNSQELATAVQYGINPVVIVFNDKAYGNPLRSQIQEYDGHVLGTELHNPDFAALARTYGARGVKAESPEELGEQLRAGLTQKTPTVIEVPVGPMERVY